MTASHSGRRWMPEAGGDLSAAPAGVGWHGDEVSSWRCVTWPRSCRVVWLRPPSLVFSPVHALCASELVVCRLSRATGCCPVGVVSVASRGA